jgi:hypothetical protein
MPNDVYTLILYQPNYSRYLGCGEYSNGTDSDLEIITFVKEERGDPFISRYALALANNQKISAWDHTEKTEVTVLIDGMDAASEQCHLEGAALPARTELRARLDALAQEKAEELLAPWREKKREEEEKLSREKLMELKAKEEAERQEFERLSRKFGSRS